MRIALFITCLTDAYFPRVGIAITLILEHLGHEVDVPAAPTCCGQPMYTSGALDDARRVAAALVDTLAPYERVVTPSASCAAMIRAHVPELLATDRARGERARTVAARTIEFVEFLRREVDPAALPPPANGGGAERVTYHPSCHLRDLERSGADGAAAATRYLDDVPGLDRRPLAAAEQCCGFGGVFALAFPEISGALAAEKASAVATSGAEVLVCNDAGCAMNIAGACRRGGTPVALTTHAEIVATRLGLLDDDAGDDR